MTALPPPSSSPPFRPAALQPITKERFSTARALSRRDQCAALAAGQVAETMNASPISGCSRKASSISVTVSGERAARSRT